MAKIIKEGLTFDDVLLIPQKSEILPKEIDTKTNLTKSIELNIPLMSAGMDTVTESKMAISMARQGGIGIIHKNMSIKEQASEVDRVKRSESGVIVDPFFLSKDHTIQDADDIMGKYRISGVPIVDEDKKLIGIITNIYSQESVDIGLIDSLEKKYNVIIENKSNNWIVTEYTAQ